MKSLILITTLLSSAIAFGGDKVGNGGGLWACLSPNQTLLKGMLVDLYEADIEFGLTPIVTSEANPANIVKERETYVARVLPQYARPWIRSLTEVQSKIRLVNAELENVDDALFRMRPLPSTCSGTWNYVQFANFTHLGQVLIRQDLWNSPVIGSLDKAALIWHEAIYSWLRKTAGDKDSVRARQIVGLLFAQLDPKDLAIEIETVLRQSGDQPQPPAPPVPAPVPPRALWVCEIKNTVTWLWHSAYGESSLEAETQTKSTCANGPEGYHCAQHTMRCDSFMENAPHSKTCTIKNNFDGQDYLGKGRSLVEAEFKARQACQNAFGDPVHCVEFSTCN